MVAARLEELRSRGFRNLLEASFVPGSRFNVISGDNGQGKSNLLEAIAYAGTLHSFRQARAEELIARGRAQAELVARVNAEGLGHVLQVTLTRQGRRRVQVDGKRPRNTTTYQRALPSVVFHPADLELTTGSAEPRRAFLDDLLSRLDETYASALSTYTRALSSRNRLLKAERPQRAAIAAYDELLASAGAVIGQARGALVVELGRRVGDAFAEITGAGDRPGLTLRYEPRVQPEVGALRRALSDALEKDAVRGFTADGPHADELSFRLDETRARRFASQGQHRAIVLALKVAELLELSQRTGHTPVLLLDDVSSELDRPRSQRFFAMLERLGGQVFLTTTDPGLVSVGEERLDFRVEAGAVTRTSV